MYRSKLIAATVAACFASGLTATAAPAQETAPATAGPPAQASVGGVSAPGDPVIDRVVCKTQCVARRKATPGAVVKVKGEFLDYVDHVVFRGPSGPIPAALTYRDPIRVRAVVPVEARSSRPYVIDSRGVRSNRAPRKLEVVPPSEIPAAIFPVRGPHDFGGAGARFGAGRSGHSHQGQDVMASCGTKMVSAVAGRVQYRSYQGSAGNYLVIDTKGAATDLVYMHLAAPALVGVGDWVAPRQKIGEVGNTGNAQGCHLHFEYWRGDWYGGGRPVDPLPYLKAWDKVS